MGWGQPDLRLRCFRLPHQSVASQPTPLPITTVMIVQPTSMP
jgi:hypothetical protein